MPTVIQDVQVAVTFRFVDDAGNTVQRHPLPPIVLDSLSPLAALTLAEALHAKRNEARRQAGLAEVPSPDTAVVLLATLRKLAQDYGDPDLERIAETVCEVVGEISRERGQGESDIVKSYCEYAEAIRSGAEGLGPEEGKPLLTRPDPGQFVYDRANGCEVT